MTGIERLRDIADMSVVDNGRSKTLRSEPSSIADQIEREQGEHVSRTRVLSVVTDMERHILGHEGMEDSPVARWARELREALGGDAEADDDREAAAWVREHFGLDYVMYEWQSRVPYDKYKEKRQRLLDHIAECETALGRRRRRIEELGHRVNDLTTENAELRKRAMPEGYEWPRYEDGELVRIGGEFVGKDGKTYTAKQIQFIGKCFSLFDFCDRKPQFSGFYGERVRRPAVLAADGEPLEVGQTVYNVGSSEERVVDHIEYEGGGTPNVYYADGGWDYPDLITHQRPLLDADGVPINVGDTVWYRTGAAHGVVESINANSILPLVVYRGDDGELYLDAVEDVTHTKPEPPDSWERIEEDADALVDAEINGEGSYNAANAYCNRRGLGEGTSFVLMAQDLVRRCRALAERERGE